MREEDASSVQNLVFSKLVFKAPPNNENIAWLPSQNDASNRYSVQKNLWNVLTNFGQEFLHTKYLIYQNSFSFFACDILKISQKFYENAKIDILNKLILHKIHMFKIVFSKNSHLQKLQKIVS